MTVAAALEVPLNVGTIRLSRGNIQLRFPEDKRAELSPAIDVLRNRKAEAMALLNAQRPPQSAVGAKVQGRRLKNHAVELWRRGERYLIVADDEVPASNCPRISR